MKTIQGEQGRLHIKTDQKEAIKIDNGGSVMLILRVGSVAFGGYGSTQAEANEDALRKARENGFTNHLEAVG